MATVAQRLSDFGQRALEAPWTWLDVSRGVTEGNLRYYVLVSKDKEWESFGWFAAVGTVANCAQEVGLFKKYINPWLVGGAGVCAGAFHWVVGYDACQKNQDDWYCRAWQITPKIMGIADICLTVRQMDCSPARACAKLAAMGVGVLNDKKHLCKTIWGIYQKISCGSQIWQVYKGTWVEKIWGAWLLYQGRKTIRSWLSGSTQRSLQNWNLKMRGAFTRSWRGS